MSKARKSAATPSQKCSCAPANILGMSFRIDLFDKFFGGCRYSASFVLLTAGSSGAFLGLVYLFTEVTPTKIFERVAAPFMWLGMNSITVYAGDEILEKAIPWIYWGDREVHLLSAVEGAFKRVFGEGAIRDMALAAADVVFWMGVAGWLHRKRWYAKL